MKRIDVIFRVHPYINDVPYFGTKADVKMGNAELEKVTPEMIEKTRKDIDIGDFKKYFSNADDFDKWGITVFLDEPEE